MATIGFIGLGNMGAPMAANLVKAGHQVASYDIVAGRAEALRTKGGRASATMAEAAAAGEIVITMLPAGPDVRSVYFGNSGVLAHARKQALLIDKDQAPRWQPATIAEVSDSTVDAYFTPIGERELRFARDC